MLFSLFGGFFRSRKKSPVSIIGIEFPRHGDDGERHGIPRVPFVKNNRHNGGADGAAGAAAYYEPIIYAECPNPLLMTTSSSVSSSVSVSTVSVPLGTPPPSTTAESDVFQKRYKYELQIPKQIQQQQQQQRQRLRVNQPSWTVLRRTRNTICSRFCI